LDQTAHNNTLDLQAQKLRSAITRSLRKQGYSVRKGLINIPEGASKESLRNLHQLAVKRKLADAKAQLHHYEDRLIQFIANGDQVQPDRIKPRLVLVNPKSLDELLFRYISLHWSIPVSSGYGRRIRFLVYDDNNNKIIGLFGLSDPVYSMSARDQWIGWDPETKQRNLYHVMNAHILGAVPPYTGLLCGKLIALLTLSNEVRAAFREKYACNVSLIRKVQRKPYLALLTTTSAFGRSSIYNRIRLNGSDFWKSIGYTQGTGEFHFSNGVYSALRSFVIERREPKMRNAAWGTGFRNKREIIRSCLAELDMSQQLLNHGIKREIFVAPLGPNVSKFLKGEIRRPSLYDRPAASLAEEFANKWLLARAERLPSFREFSRESYRLWEGGSKKR